MAIFKKSMDCAVLKCETWTWQHWVLISKAWTHQLVLLSVQETVLLNDGAHGHWGTHTACGTWSNHHWNQGRRRREQSRLQQGRADHQLRALMSYKRIIFSGTQLVHWTMTGEVVPVHHWSGHSGMRGGLSSVSLRATARWTRPSKEEPQLVEKVKLSLGVEKVGFPWKAGSCWWRRRNWVLREGDLSRIENIQLASGLPSKELPGNTGRELVVVKKSRPMTLLFM